MIRHTRRSLVNLLSVNGLEEKPVDQEATRRCVSIVSQMTAETNPQNYLGGGCIFT